MLSQRSIFGIGLVILSIISAASIGLDIKSRLDAGWIDETVDLLRRLSDIRLLVRDAESAATGYALQSDIRLADEYRASLQRVAPSFAELKQRIKDSPETAELVAATETLVNRRLAATSEGVARQSAGDTAGLAEMMSISYAEAESIKVGMVPEILSALELHVLPLGRELRASLDFFEHQHDRPVTQVFVSGGSARSEMILQMLHAELVAECKTWNPTTFLQMSLPGQQAVEIEHLGSQLAVAVGAALAAG